MNKVKILNKVQLYVIADPSLCLNRDLIELIPLAIVGGAQMVQFRDKKSSAKEFLEKAIEIHKITQRENIPLIVNDRVDIAKSLDAEGIHLGKEDLPLKEARKILGSKKIIGASAGDIETAKLRQREGADYIGLGPVFETSSKVIEKAIGVEIFKEAKRSLEIPFFPIGGINLYNLEKLLACGVKSVAVISAIFEVEDVIKATQMFLKKLT